MSSKKGKTVAEHFDYYQFASDQWRQAARRFLELEQKIAELEAQDDQLDHEALGEFSGCEICEQTRELKHKYEQFAQHFATIWAKHALRLEREKREGR